MRSASFSILEKSSVASAAFAHSFAPSVSGTVKLATVPTFVQSCTPSADLWASMPSAMAVRSAFKRSSNFFMSQTPVG